MILAEFATLPLAFGHLRLILVIPELLQLRVSFAVSERKILEALRCRLVLLDLLPPARDEFHDLLGVEVLVARLLLDLFTLLLREEDIRRQRLAWWFHAVEYARLLHLEVHVEEMPKFSVPLLAPLAVLEGLHMPRLLLVFILNGLLVL